MPCWLWGVVRFEALVADVFICRGLSGADVGDSENGLLVTVVFCWLMDR